MTKPRFLLFAGLLLTGLYACATPSGTAPPTQTQTKATVEAPAPRTTQPPSPRTTPAPAAITARQPGDLPCAVVEAGVSPVIRYAADSLYRPAAVLPTETGLACLETLAVWLKAGSAERWQATVAGEDGHGFTPAALAEKRRELLERFFVRKGIAAQDWDWQTTAQPGAQLELRQVTGSP